MSLTFYTNPMSRGRMVRWMLEEIGAPYETVILEYGPAMKGAEYLAINPMGKIPAIVHHDVAITETAAIIAYLAEAFPEAGLAPSLHSPKRGAYHRWMYFAAGPLEMGIMNTAMGLDVPAGRERMAGYGTFALLQDVTEQLVSQGPYILGDEFSAVDVYLGSQIGFGMMFKAVEPRPAFVDYVKRIHARSAAMRAQEIEDKLAARA
jgi:glutathione S-transferase